jgi:hypothetical protein
MKCSLLFGSVIILAAAAGPAHAQDPFESQLSARLDRAVSLSSSEVKQNEIVKEHIAYSGIAVELLKSDNPLELINPFAPDKYATFEDNTLPDPSTGRPRGWKLFSIQF